MTNGTFFFAFSQETFSIMGEPATAMRDPIFYRFHAFTDDVFLEHKNTLPEYSLQQVGVHSCLAYAIYHRFTLVYDAAKYTYHVVQNYVSHLTIKKNFAKPFNPTKSLETSEFIINLFIRMPGNLVKY